MAFFLKANDTYVLDNGKLGGPGENPLPYDSLTYTLPPVDQWPPNDDWDLHCGNPGTI